MNNLVRAGGIAAAAFACLLGLGPAAPSEALSTDTGSAISYLAHADAGMTGAESSALSALVERIAGVAWSAVPRLRSLEELVDLYADDEVAEGEQACLAKAVYFEARGEPLEGQLAVADVVLNRAASGKYPASICEVVTQKAQFSFIENGRFPTPDWGSEAWERAVAVARIARENLDEAVPSDVLWYHADYVAPVWRHGLAESETIGAHIFYGPKARG